MKVFLLIFVLIGFTLAVAYFDAPFFQQEHVLRNETAVQDPLAATNHNWSNR